MEREILEVRRCGKCQTVVQALVQDTDLGGSEEPVRAVFWLPYRMHTDGDCVRMQALAREEWPCLF